MRSSGCGVRWTTSLRRHVAPCRLVSYSVAMSTNTAGALPLPHVTFGDRLRRVRLNTGLDQRTFAETIAISHAALGKYELSPHTPRVAKLVANSVQLAWGVPAVWLLTGETPGDDPSVRREGLEPPTRCLGASADVIPLLPATPRRAA